MELLVVINTVFSWWFYYFWKELFKLNLLKQREPGQLQSAWKKFTCLIPQTPHQWSEVGRAGDPGIASQARSVFTWLSCTAPGIHHLDVHIHSSHTKADLALCNLESPLKHCHGQCSICMFVECQVSTFFVTLWHDLRVTFCGCWQIFRHLGFTSGNLEEWQMVLGRVGTYYKMSAGSFITRWCPVSKLCYQRGL